MIRGAGTFYARCCTDSGRLRSPHNSTRARLAFSRFPTWLVQTTEKQGREPVEQSLPAEVQQGKGGQRAQNRKRDTNGEIPQRCSIAQSLVTQGILGLVLGSATGLLGGLGHVTWPLCASVSPPVFGRFQLSSCLSAVPQGPTQLGYLQ